MLRSKKTLGSVRSTVISRRTKFLSVAAAGASAMLTGASAFAQTQVTWVGTTGPYTTDVNWNPVVVPSNAANQFLTINNGGTAQVGAADAAEGTYLNLGLSPGNTGHLEVSGGTLTVGELRVGGRDDSSQPSAGTNGGGIGTVLQTGGNVRVNYTPGAEPPIQSLYVGDGGLASGNTANGTYNISAGTLLSGIATDDSIIVGTGAGTQGTFIQSGGGVTSTGFVTVARRGATGSYTLSGGTLAAQGQNGLWIGDGDGTAVAATGTFVQTAGGVTVAGSVEMGRRAGTGSYDITGGTLTSTGQIVVGGGSGVSTTALLKGNGTMHIGGTAVVNVANNINIGLGSATVAGNITGLLNMDGGSISMSSPTAILAVGNGLGVNATFNLSAGSVTMNAGTSTSVDVGRSSSAGLLKLSGTGSLSAANLTLNSSNVSVIREVRVEGGALTLGTLNNGSGNTTATRTLTVSGSGVLNVTGATTGGRLVTYNLTGGSTTFGGIMSLDTSTMNVNTTSAANTVSFGTLRVQSGTVNIAGGTVTATAVNDAGNQAGVVNLSGGSLAVSGNYNVTQASPASGGAGALNITGGTFSANSLATNGSATNPNSTLYISGGSVTIPTITLSSTSILKTDNTISLGSNFTYGDATANINSGSLTLTGTFGTGAARTLTKTGTGTLNINGTQTYATNSAIVVAAGTLNLATQINGVGATASLALTANSTTNINANAGLSALNVGNAATATLGADGSRSVVTNTIAITGGGKFDLKDNHLVVKTTPLGTYNGTAYTDVAGLIQSGRNGGTWTGSGIVTSQSTAATGNLTTIGIASASQVKGIAATSTTVWASQTVTGSDTLVMYTYGGDANLDGKINVDDYTRIDFNVPLGVAGWYNGDFNYDGKINVDDYTIIDFNVGIQGSPFIAGSGGGLSVTAVPEPASLGIVGLAASALLARRRRRFRA